MQSLEALTRDARALANGEIVLSAPETEVARQMQICNACRYCEGFCAVFPAMTRRLEFGKADIHFLANLCHNCGACLHACQYAPPHEFAVNVPQAMAQVRGQTYVDYAWPPALGRLYQRNGLTLSLALAAGLALFLLLALALNGTLWGGDLRGNFYSLFPHNLLVGMFAPVFLWAVLALGLGVRRFWRDVTPATSGLPVTLAGSGRGDRRRAAAEVPGRRPRRRLPQRRRRLHAVAAARPSPDLLRLHAVLCRHQRGHAVPLRLRLVSALRPAQPAQAAGRGRRREPAAGHGGAVPAEPAGAIRSTATRRKSRWTCGFIALLFFTSLTGLALWLARGTPALAALLAIHLGVVMALFATLPYGKFAHGIFRTASLLRHAVEKRQPNPVGLGAD